MNHLIINKSLKINFRNSSQVYDEFKLLKTDEERVKFSMKFISERNKGTSDMDLISKGSEASSVFKNEGNKLYALTKESNLNRIIELYTKSAAYAPPGSKELALAFANRSAALFKGRLYDECLADINRALDLYYPDNLKAKLVTRKAQCLVMLEASSSEVDKTVQEARKWLEKMDESNQSKKIIEKVLDNPIKKDDFPKQTIVLEREQELPEIADNNPEVQGVSSAVEIAYSEEFGRHLVATRNIDPGEIIAVKKGYASVIAADKHYTNCSNCLKQTWSGIPCDFCVEIIYCSEECRQEAWEDYHDIECQLLGPFKTYGLPMTAYLALRLAVRAVKDAGSIENLRKYLEILDNHQDPRTKGFSKNIFDDTKYASVYTLKTNTEERSFYDLFITSISSVYLVHILTVKRNNIFGKQFEADFKKVIQDPSVIFIGGLILKHMQITQTNSYSMAEIFRDFNYLERGYCVIPFLSLYNHSCNSQCCRVAIRNTMVQMAILPIKKGDQVFDNYGIHFAGTKKPQRELYLKQIYCFDCNCVACKENWPDSDQLQTIMNAKLPDEMLKILLVKVQKLETIYSEVLAKKWHDKNQINKDLIEILKYFGENFSPPYRELFVAVDAFRRIFLLQGNRLQILD